MHKEIGFIGLGRMGNALCAHLVEQGFAVHGFDTQIEAQHAAQLVGVTIHASVEALVGSLSNAPKVIWIMVPSRYVDDVLDDLVNYLNAGDCIIDGGNSFFKDSIKRHDDLEQKGIHFIDCGTSGGVTGARQGASLMVGGDMEVVTYYQPLFETLAVPDGFAYVGDAGAGHFTKMVHNAIEYGMMGAIAEGVNILNEHKEGLAIKIPEALKPFKNGSIIESNLITWLSKAYNTEGYLEHIAGKVPKGETEMEMEYLIANENVHVLEAAVLQRKLSRTNPSFIGTLISAMRNQFGGHQTFKK